MKTFPTIFLGPTRATVLRTSDEAGRPACSTSPPFPFPCPGRLGSERQTWPQRPKSASVSCWAYPATARYRKVNDMVVRNTMKTWPGWFQRAKVKGTGNKDSLGHMGLWFGPSTTHSAILSKISPSSCHPHLCQRMTVGISTHWVTSF